MMNRLMRGKRLTDLCREYGISRKTGDKFRRRFLDYGTSGLRDQSRAPRVIPHRTPPELAALVVEERKRHPTWGPKKLKVILEQRLGRRLPSATTLGAILSKHGLVERRTYRRRSRPQPTTLREAHAPNDIWCIDYKGQFRLGDGSHCYPLTLTDQYSRFILCCEGMAAISDDAACEACEEVFRTYGLPRVMRSDNGVPFASTGLAGLTRLSVYWTRLGVIRERIRPAHPEENGRHERMHRTLKRETARPARTNLLQQQERFDDFLDEFNRERPHEALAMKCPAEIYAASPRPYPTRLPDPEYPDYDDVLLVRREGSVTFLGRRIYLAAALAGQRVGIREEDDRRWLVTFMRLELGHILPDRTFAPLLPSNPPEAA
jgi:transposase InsO family protein